MDHLDDTVSYRDRFKIRRFQMGMMYQKISEEGFISEWNTALYGYRNSGNTYRITYHELQNIYKALNFHLNADGPAFEALIAELLNMKLIQQEQANGNVTIFTLFLDEYTYSNES